ncbi:MAG: hypothetical protein RSC43_06760, partial [Clostridia bacterium]
MATKGLSKEKKDMISFWSDEYYKAKKDGDPSGMRNANERANGIRRTAGEPNYSARNDISYSEYRNNKSSKPGSSYSSPNYSNQYYYARANGDAAGMRAANAAANAERAANGYGSYNANVDIGMVEKGGARGSVPFGYDAYGSSVMQNSNRYFNDYDEQMMSANEASRNANEAAISAGTGRLQSRIPQINSDYQEAAREAYIANRIGKKDAAASLAASGISQTGVSESALASRDSAYERLLSEGNRERISAIGSVEDSIINLMNDGNLQAAQQEAQNAMERASKLYDKAVMMQNHSWQLDNRDYERRNAVSDRDYERRNTVADRNQDNEWMIENRDVIRGY